MFKPAVERPRRDCGRPMDPTGYVGARRRLVQSHDDFDAITAAASRHEADGVFGAGFSAMAGADPKDRGLQALKIHLTLPSA
jgi:hypothetical protein